MRYTSSKGLRDGSAAPANDYTRGRWMRYHSGQMSVQEKKFWREFNRDHSRRDVLSTHTASQWIKFQRREHIVFWPRRPRTRSAGFVIV